MIRLTPVPSAAGEVVELFSLLEWSYIRTLGPRLAKDRSHELQNEQHARRPGRRHFITLSPWAVSAQPLCMLPKL